MFFDAVIVAVLAVTMILAVVYFAEDPLDPLALFSYLYFPPFVIRPALLLFDMDEPFLSFLFHDDPHELVMRAALIFGLAYLSFLAGYVGGRGSFTNALASTLPGFSASRLDDRRLWIVVWGGVILSSIIIGFFVLRLGGINNFMFESRHGLWSGISFLGRVPLVGSYFAALLLVRRLENVRRLPGVFLVFGISLLLPALMGDRSGAVYPLIICLVVYHLSIRRIPLTYLAFGFLLTVATVGGLGVLREATYANRELDVWTALQQRDVDSQSWARSVSEYLSLSSVDYFMVVLQDHDWVNFHYGEDFLRGLIGVIPRSLWPDKPESITLGSWFRDRYVPGSSGKPFTAIGGWWINFGLPGVVFGLALSGYACRVVWEYAKRSGFKPWTSLFYVSLFFNVTSWGVFTTTFPMAFILWVVPLLVIYAYIVTDAPQPAADAPPGRTSLASSQVLLFPKTPVDRE